MNYRHAFHAGNFADVAKHAVLAMVLCYLQQKPAAIRVLDTHAGIGDYDLTAEAARTGEWQNGIARLLGAEAEPLPAGIAAMLAPWLDLVRRMNPDGTLKAYPGSPRLVRDLLRPQDRLVACELHPEDHAILAAAFARDRQTTVLLQDGWQALKAQLPPPERRGLVLVDPSYEDPDELGHLVDGLRTATGRFPTGVYVLWHPIKDLALVERLHEAIAALSLPKVLAAEMLVRTPGRGLGRSGGLDGAGLLVVNPPWTLAADLDVLLPFLALRLAQGPGATAKVAWIDPVPLRDGG